LPKIAKHGLPAVILSQREEFELFNEAHKFLKSEFDCEIELIKAEDSDSPKAKNASPAKAAILVE